MSEYQGHDPLGPSLNCAMRMLIGQFMFAELVGMFDGLDREAADVVLTMFRHVYGKFIEPHDKTLWGVWGRPHDLFDGKAHLVTFPELEGASIVIVYRQIDPVPWIVDFCVPGSSRPAMTIYTPQDHGPRLTN